MRTAQVEVANVSSAGTARTTELSSIAPIDITTVSSEMIAIGTPYCTERLIVPTSRVTRVTRSPVLAPSTAPSGSRRIVRTMNSRAVESRSWPKSVEVRWATQVKTARAGSQCVEHDERGEGPPAGPEQVLEEGEDLRVAGHRPAALGVARRGVDVLGALTAYVVAPPEGVPPLAPRGVG